MSKLFMKLYFLFQLTFNNQPNQYFVSTEEFLFNSLSCCKMML